MNKATAQHMINDILSGIDKLNFIKTNQTHTIHKHKQTTQNTHNIKRNLPNKQHSQRNNRYTQLIQLQITPKQVCNTKTHANN